MVAGTPQGCGSQSLGCGSASPHLVAFRFLPARSSKVLETYIKSSKRGFEGRVGVFLGENVRRCAHKSRVSLRVELGSAGVPGTVGGWGQWGGWGRREAGDSGRPGTAGGCRVWHPVLAACPEKQSCVLCDSCFPLRRTYPAPRRLLRLYQKRTAWCLCGNRCLELPLPDRLLEVCACLSLW